MEASIDMRLGDCLDVLENCEALEEYSTWLARLAKRRGVQDHDFPLYTNLCKRPADISELAAVHQPGTRRS